jgi:hypothetical protein
MPDQIEEQHLFKLLFMEIIYSFQNLAIMQLGKVVNPVTNQIEKNLEQAKATIDMLRMLKEKTKGNLSDEENRLIEQVVLTLQLNYADEASRETKEKLENK